MKAPEYLLSTPRLILVILTIWLMVFTYTGITDATVFKDIALVVFWYFFWSRWSETAKTEWDTTTITTPKEEIQSIHNLPDNWQMGW